MKLVTIHRVVRDPITGAFMDLRHRCFVVRKVARPILALTACLWASLAFGQANNSSVWQTPGNQTVGGAVQLCLNASS